MGVFREVVRKDVGEFRPGIGGRGERLVSIIRIELVAADIDIDRSWLVRSRRKTGPPGMVLEDSDERRVDAIDGSTNVEEAGEVLTADVIVAMTAVSN